MIELRDTEGMFIFIMHPSLWRGICEAANLTPEITNTLGPEDSIALDHWAEYICDNPSGQRSDLARAVAGLIRVTGSLRITQDNKGGASNFWEAVGQ